MSVTCLWGLRRYPEAAFAILRDALLAQGPAGHCRNAPACSLCWPPLLDVRAALAQLPDAPLLEWLLLYGEHGVVIEPVLRLVSPQRCRHVYDKLDATYQGLLSLSGFPAAPPWPHASAPARGAPARASVPEAVPRAWLSVALADGPMHLVCSVPRLTSAHPETEAARRQRLEDPAEREAGMVELIIDGAHLACCVDGTATLPAAGTPRCCNWP